MHRCEATNEADSLSFHGDRLEFDSRKMRPPAEVRLFVQYAPSVTVTPTRPGMVQEGDKVIFSLTKQHQAYYIMIFNFAL